MKHKKLMPTVVRAAKVIFIVVPYLWLGAIGLRELASVGPLQAEPVAYQLGDGTVVAGPRFWFASPIMLLGGPSRERFQRGPQWQQFGFEESGLSIYCDSTRVGPTAQTPEGRLETIGFRVDEEKGSPEQLGSHSTLIWAYPPAGDVSEPLLISVGHSYVVRVTIRDATSTKEAYSILRDIGLTLQAW